MSENTRPPVPGHEDADPITYARAHLTSPGAHALLDEVERGKQRRANREGLPTHYTPHGGERRPLGEQEN